MLWFAIASLTPPALLALACGIGGVFPLLAVLSITVVVFFADKLPRSLPVQDASGRLVSLCLAAVHFPVLAFGLWALSSGTHLSLLDKILIFTGMGLFFGQISNSNAHELIHAQPRWLRRLGALLYISVLHGHHVSAHLRVHHVHAGTDADPNSARLGEGFWRYCARATGGEFAAGLRAENAHRSRAAAGLPPLSHPYLAYIGGGMGLILLCWLSLGGKAVAIYLGIAAYAQLQLLLSDYVQHYGLRRHVQPDGKLEPMGLQHSWNAPKWYSGAMMLNAPRHSDHHMRPAKAFPSLSLDAQTMPMLPHSLPVMAVVALIPPIWRRVMDRRVARWQSTA